MSSGTHVFFKGFGRPQPRTRVKETRPPVFVSLPRGRGGRTKEMKQSTGADARQLIGLGVDVHDINDLRLGVENFITSFRTKGVVLLRCYEGRYRVLRKGYPVILLKEEETFAIYPGHVVTIDALKPSNRLVYGVFTGRDVIGYFNDLGCFDGLHCATLPRFESMARLGRLAKSKAYRTQAGHDACLSYLSDLVSSIVGDARASGNTIVFDAIRQIRVNLANGVVRLQELCDELNVCRSYLHRVFRDAGLGGIAAFIKAEQLQLALWLLRNTDQSVAEIAKASGFISTSHFSTFIKKRTGRPPRELR